MQGWIKLHRKLIENQIWDEKPFSKGQAWIDLLLMANHVPKQLILGNTIIDLERGQFHTSELKLMKRWGWSKKKVRAYLLLLKTLKMATVEGTTKGTTITIENYSLYQDMGTTQDTVEDTAKEPQRNRKGYTNKNIKNNKNNIYVDFFEEIWKKYPKKEGKGKVSIMQKQKLYKIGLEEMTRAIERYKKAKAGTEQKYWQIGSTFFNSGYVDYLDANYQEEKPKSKLQEVKIEW